MKILVKFPTRQRPQQAVEALNEAIKNQVTAQVHYLLTIDDDDRSMDAIRNVVKKHDHISIDEGIATSKINAVNKGILAHKTDWDILVLLSDDMICQSKGWDATLISEMIEYYPDTDGVLFHNDGYLGSKLNTMCILGRNYYERFGYIYHPAYKSFWCDNEFMEVAEKLGRQTYFEEVLFKHQHPANTGGTSDALYLKNNDNFVSDKQLYDERKSKQFDLAVHIDSDN